MNPVLGFIDAALTITELGQPFALAPHQREVLQLAFAFDDRGLLPWDTILYACIKKSGKTTINAAVTTAWAFTQEAPNEVIVLANDQEQAAGRAYAGVAALIRKNGLTASVVGGEQGLARTAFTLVTGTTVRAIASDAGSAAGSNHGLTSWDELWAYSGARMQRLWDEMTPVPTRKNSVRFITTYAGFEGESTTLWDLYKLTVGPDELAEGQGERLHPDLPVYVNRAARTFAYWDHDPRLPWQTSAYYAAERRRLRPAAYLRIHENRWTAGVAVFLEAAAWRACEDPAARPVVRDGSLRVVVGLDAGIKKDSAAAVAVAMDEATGRPRVVNHAVFVPTPENPVDLEATLEETVLDWDTRYDVIKVVYDPHQLAVIANHLTAAGLTVEEFPQTTDRLTAMGQLLWDLVTHRNLQLYVDEALRAHAAHAVAVETPRGLRIAKEKARHKIDLVVALAMALRALVGLDGGDLQLFVVEPGPPAEPAPADPAAAAAQEAADRAREREQARQIWNREDAWRS